MACYLVTGGAGFIGSHLCDRLIETGHQVIIVDNLSVGNHCHPEAELIQIDILDEKKLAPIFKRIDGCFHLAAIPSVEMRMNQWFDFHAINLQGSLNIFKLAHLAGNIPVIYASSCAVYGECEALPLKEKSYIRPISFYGCDKLSTELNAHVMAKNYSLPTMGLRFFNVYGPRQNPASPYSGVISLFIDHILHNQPITIFGSGEQTRDFIYVDDIVSGLLQAMQQVKPDGNVVNLCTGHGTSISELTDKISKITHKTPIIEYKPRRTYDVMHSLGSTEKMHSLGFNAKTKLSAGLKQTIDYMIQNNL